MITGLEYWYDGQMRRFLNQVVRAFSGFQYRTGVDASGQTQLKMVPCRMALTDKMVAQIINNASENTLNVVPLIAISRTALAGRRADVQNPNHVDTRQVVERAIDPITGKYTSEKGNSYTVQRMMPRPFEMTINVDIWTSNTDQKDQLAEQIMTIFYPDITIQNSDNALDWTAMTVMEMTDINFSSRTIPIGTSDEIDIMTFTFRLPFWLSPPAKVKQQKVIEQIVANIYDTARDEPITYTGTKMITDIVTPGNHSINVRNGKLILLGPKASTTTPDGHIYNWIELLNEYGMLRPTISTIRLKNGLDLDDTSHDIVGTIQFDNNNPNELFWQIDPTTLPGNTISPLLAIIDPRKSYPGNGLIAAANGQRYMLTESLSASSAAWGNLAAHANDIIQYSGTTGNWTVVYRPIIGDTAPAYVLNQHTGNQLKWSGEEWLFTIHDIYFPGYWRISL